MKPAEALLTAYAWALQRVTKRRSVIINALGAGVWLDTCMRCERVYNSPYCKSALWCPKCVKETRHDG